MSTPPESGGRGEFTGPAFPPHASRMRNEICCDPGSLSAVYAPDVNLAVWQRALTFAQKQAARHLVESSRFSSINAVVCAGSIGELLQTRLLDVGGKQTVIDDASFAGGYVHLSF